MDKLLEEFTSQHHEVSTKPPKHKEFHGDTLDYDVVQKEGQAPVLHIFKPGEWYLRRIDAKAWGSNVNPYSHTIKTLAEKSLASKARQMLSVSRELQMEWKSVPWPSNIRTVLEKTIEKMALDIYKPVVGYDGLVDSWWVKLPGMKDVFGNNLDRLLALCKKVDSQLSHRSEWKRVLRRTKEYYQKVVDGTADK